MSKPQVTSYLSVHQYLQDLYTRHKSQSPKFSYDLWSRQLGLKSRSYLRMVVVGKRSITAAFTEIFCRSMDFNDKERDISKFWSYTHSVVHTNKKNSVAKNSLIS